MHTTLWNLLSGHPTVALIGMCKNAGKTTVLNHLVASANASGVTLGLSSIGRDGEDTDVVTGTHKPGIWVRRGTLVATAKDLLPHCDITREVLAATGLSTPLGEVVVVRALSDGAVQLAGPSTVSRMSAVRKLLLDFGAEKVLVDGALGRKTLSARALSDTSVLCTGASCGASVDTVVAETAHFCALALLPEVADDIIRTIAETNNAKLALLGDAHIPLPGGALPAALDAHPDNHTHTLFVGGALTDAMLAPLIANARRYAGLRLVTQDASKLLLSRATLERMRAGGLILEVLKSIRLKAVATNPFSARGAPFNPDEFLEKMRAAVPLPVFDVIKSKEVPTCG